MKINQIIHSDCLTYLRSLPEKSVQCVITSPPYFGLRAYGTEPFNWPASSYSILGFPVSVPEMTCELGQEADHFAFIGHLVLIFQEANRILKDDGVMWVNMGDSYSGSDKGAWDAPIERKSAVKGTYMPERKDLKQSGKTFANTKPKDLIGIPWMLAFALRDAGLYLRQDIIWSKPNPMPESVTDRCTKAHEYIFMLSKSPKYYFDNESIKTPVQGEWGTRDRTNGKYTSDKNQTGLQPHGGLEKQYDMANKRSVWTVTTKPFKDAHFATFPEDLIVDMIKSSSRPEDTILDMFMGAGTTALVARKTNRNFIGSELNSDYIKIAEKRLQSLGLFQ